MSEQLEALRRYGDPNGRGSSHPQNIACRWAAQEIDRLRAENAELLACMRFADTLSVPHLRQMKADGRAFPAHTLNWLDRITACLAKSKQEGGKL